MSKRYITLVAIGAALTVVCVAYRPLKFHYAIWRMESAATPAQERDACLLAKRVGHVWEVNDIHTNEFRVLPSRIQPGTNEVVVEVEWWQGPWWDFGNPPYRAYRVFLDPKNRELLTQN